MCEQVECKGLCEDVRRDKEAVHWCENAAMRSKNGSGRGSVFYSAQGQ
jgi:hypothetical protein